MSEAVKNIVLVGRTGNGKSATGNTILGQVLFKSKKQAVGVTMECESYRGAIQDGPIVNVIDTPGLNDSGQTKELTEEIVKCLSKAKEGIHAVLFVLSTKNRTTPEEESTLNTLQRIFDTTFLDYVIVVFTGGDELEADGQTLDDYFSAGCPDFLMRLLRLCGGRKISFDNRTEKKEKKVEQLKQLLALIADVGNQTSGIPYTDIMHRKIKEEEEKQEREIESKKAAEAEFAVIQEKLRLEIEFKNIAEKKIAEMQEELQLEREKNKQEEDNRLREQQMNVESKKTRMVYARDLNIIWSEDSRYWSWVPLQFETSSEKFVEVAKLEEVWWLDVGGKVDTKELTPFTHYEVMYLVKLKKTATGWDTPVNLRLTLPGRKPDERSISLKEHIGKSWVFIQAGEFMTTPENAGEIWFCMYETSSNRLEGLIVQGVAIRPKHY